MFGAMTRAAERWRSIRITELERRQMAALRHELDHDYEAAVGLDTGRSGDTPAAKIPSRSRTDPDDRLPAAAPLGPHATRSMRKNRCQVAGEEGR